jgi:spore coat assembly protein SafA
MVKKGETLYQLSEKYQVDLEKIIEMNPQIENPDVIDVGMKVKIPSKPSQVGYSNIPKSIDKLEQTKTKPTETIAKDTKLPEYTMKAKDTKQQPEATMKAKETQPKAETVKPMQAAQPYETGKWADPVKPQKTEDLFDQYKVPAEKVGSFYDIPEIPDMKESELDYKQPQQYPSSSGSMHPQYYAHDSGEMQSYSYPSQPSCGFMPMQDPMMYHNNMMPYNNMMANPISPYGMTGDVPCDVPVYPGINNNMHHPMHMNPHIYGMPYPMPPNPMMPYGQMTPQSWNFTGRDDSNKDSVEGNTSETRGDNESFDNKDSIKRSNKAVIRSKKAPKTKKQNKTSKNEKRLIRESESIPWLNQ